MDCLFQPWPPPGLTLASRKDTRARRQCSLSRLSLTQDSRRWGIWNIRAPAHCPNNMKYGTHFYFLTKLSKPVRSSDNTYHEVRFQVLAETNMKMIVFWDVGPCSLVEVYRRFRGTCCLQHRATSQKTAIYILWGLLAIQFYESKFSRKMCFV
jgi:hypothetical protein